MEKEGDLEGGGQGLFKQKAAGIFADRLPWLPF